MIETIKKWGLLFILFVVPIIAFNFFNKAENNFRKLAIIGPEGHVIPSFEFTNQNGDKVSNQDYKDDIYLANFIFTTCPTICPTMTINMRYVQEKMKIYPNIKFISHTVNPEYDTPKILKEYAKRMRVNEDNFNFVTGNKKEIYNIAKSYFVNVAEDKIAPGGFLHSEYLVLVDRDGRIRSGFTNYICSTCQTTSKKYTDTCPKTGEKNTMKGNPFGSYDGTQDFVIKDLIKDIKTLMAEYHEDAKVERNEK